MRLWFGLVIMMLMAVEGEEGKRRLWCFNEVGCLLVMPRNVRSNQVNEANLLCNMLRRGGRLVGQSQSQKHLCQQAVLRKIEDEWDEDVLLDARAWRDQEAGTVSFLWGVDESLVDEVGVLNPSSCDVEEAVLLMREGAVVVEMCPVQKNKKYLAVCAFPCGPPMNLSAVASAEECASACLDNPPCRHSTFSLPSLCVLHPPPSHPENCSTHFGKSLLSEVVAGGVVVEEWKDYDVNSQDDSEFIKLVIILTVVAFCLIICSVCLCFCLLLDRHAFENQESRGQMPEIVSDQKRKKEVFEQVTKISKMVEMEEASAGNMLDDATQTSLQELTLKKNADQQSLKSAASKKETEKSKRAESKALSKEHPSWLGKGAKKEPVRSRTIVKTDIKVPVRHVEMPTKIDNFPTPGMAISKEHTIKSTDIVKPNQIKHKPTMFPSRLPAALLRKGPSAANQGTQSPGAKVPQGTQTGGSLKPILKSTKLEQNEGRGSNQATEDETLSELTTIREDGMMDPSKRDEEREKRKKEKKEEISSKKEEISSKKAQYLLESLRLDLELLKFYRKRTDK